MKKPVSIITTILVGIMSFLLFFNYGRSYYPNELYNVYLDGELLGTILSREELLEHINQEADPYINTKMIVRNDCEEEADEEENNENCYITTKVEGDRVDRIDIPSGLRIERRYTFANRISTVEEVFEKIQAISPFTVRGYEFTVRFEDDVLNINVLDRETFEEAVELLFEIFLGEETYASFANNTQQEIITTGTFIEEVYLEADITIRERRIPVNETIYIDSAELSEFLLFGHAPVTSKHTVSQGEMISDIALNNRISVQEFLISNPIFNNPNSLLREGTEVEIKETNPQLRVAVIQTVVEDKVSHFQIQNRVDSTKNVGYRRVEQVGEEGLERISQREKIINGVINFVEPKGKEVLRAAVDEVVVRGDRRVPHVGDLSRWGWPTESGWSVSSDYGWRIHPITRQRQFHPAIDIVGTGYGSRIFAVNNGVVEARRRGGGYGNYVIINHNNGYWTVYAHMLRFAAGIEEGSVVERGQVIGYVGSTGMAVGPHLHFEAWRGWRNPINPWTLYR